jgi:endonuclease/exonuclease/phosphatase family metal-dependent hydrolase
MVKFIKSISFKSLIFLNLLFGLLFIACCYAPDMPPQKWWFMGFLSLFLPYLFFLMLFFLLLWIFIKSKWFFFPLVVLLIGVFKLSSHYSFTFSTKFNPSNQGTLRVMSWNIRHFIPFYETKFKPNKEEQTQKIFDEIKQYSPDIICLQEFISIPSLGSTDPMNYLKERLGYKYVQFEGEDVFGIKHRSGNAIFSKIPFIKSGVIKFPYDVKGQTENMVYADLLSGKDTIRVYSLHLKSFGFGDREYRAIEEAKNESDYNIGESKNVLRKMRNTFRWHGLQSDFVKSNISSSPYPFILTGDFNDVPTSYAYKTIKGSLQDVFIERGSGLGNTFISATSSFLRVLPTLRIDYIFADQSFNTVQFFKGGERISDHLFLLADFNGLQ